MSAATAFQGVTAGSLAAVTFTVAPGERFGVMAGGEAEELLLLRLLLGLRAPAAGSVALLGTPLDGLFPAGLSLLRRRVGTVQPHGRLISNLRVLENVALPLEYLSRDEAAGEAARALAAVRYAGSPEARTVDLSPAGVRQVALARAAAIGPELLVCRSLFRGLGRRERVLVERSLEGALELLPGAAVLHIVSGTADLPVRGEMNTIRIGGGEG